MIQETEDAQELEQLKAIEALISMNVKKPKSSKEKEKKIVDFKCRVFELLEIFLSKTKDPMLFVQNLAPLMLMIKQNYQSKSMKNLVQKIAQMIKNYVNKKQIFKAEKITNLQECLQVCLSFSYKTNDRTMFMTLKEIIFSIFQIYQEIMTKQESENEIQMSIQQILQNLSRKKTVLYDSQFFKDFIKKFPQLSFKLIKITIQFINIKEKGGASNDRIRKQFLEIFYFLLINENIKDQVEKELNNYVVTICKSLGGIIGQYENMKWKKNSIMRDVLNIVGRVVVITKNKEIKNNLLEEVKGLKVDEKTIQNQKNRLIEQIEQL